MAEWNTPKTDWVTNPKNPVAEDFNRIEGNIDFLKGDIETKKGAIVNALNTVGLETQLTDTHAQIANKIVAANQGTKIYTPSTVNQPIPKGFHSGQGYVKGDSNLVAMNIKKGVSIFDVNGNYVTPVIKSIQYGSATTPSQTGTKTVTIDINAVDISKSIIIIEFKDSRSDSSIELYDISFISSTQFEIKIYTGYNTECPFVWKVIEFNPDIVKSIQRGVTRVSPSEPTANVTISSVDRTKSIPIILSFYAREERDDVYYMKGGCYLTSNTNLRIEGNETFIFNVIWNVIEFY